MRSAREGVFSELLPPDFESRLSLIEETPVVEGPCGIGPAHDVAGDGSVLVVDLPGHLAGHVGLCFAGLGRPLLYATDTQWLLRAITEDRLPGFPASLIAHDRAAGVRSAARVRAFVAAGGEAMLCHDPHRHRLDLDPEVGG